MYKSFLEGMKHPEKDELKVNKGDFKRRLEMFL